MYDLKIVRNYAVALFENADSAKEQDKFLQQLTDIVALMEKDSEKDSENVSENVLEKGSKIYEIMCSPVISSDVKHKGIDFISEKLKLEVKVITFLKILARNARFALISEILDYFTILHNDENDTKQAQVLSAKKMTQKEIDLIKTFLDEEIGMDVKIENHIDESLLGGVLIKYDSTLIDCSLKGALNQIENVAKKID